MTALGELIRRPHRGVMLHWDETAFVAIAHDRGVILASARGDCEERAMNALRRTVARGPTASVQPWEVVPVRTERALGVPPCERQSPSGLLGWIVIAIAFAAVAAVAIGRRVL